MKKNTNHKRLLITCFLMVLAALVFAYFNTDSTADPGTSPDVSAEAPTEEGAQEPVSTTPVIIGGVSAIVVYYLFTLLTGSAKKRRKKNK